MMYEELIKDLRHCADAPAQPGCAANCKYGEEHPLNYWCISVMMQEAADAIEKLSAFTAQITDGRFYFAKDGVLFELKNDPREIRVSSPWLPDPPKEEI